MILRELEKEDLSHLPKLRSNYQDVIVLKYYYELPNQAISELLKGSQKRMFRFESSGQNNGFVSLLSMKRIYN